MGSAFFVYLRLGFEHLADLNGIDHLLFIAALCALYQPRDWRPLLVLVTAFTVGHSLTLALATLGVFRPDAALIEILIPVTILATCGVNVFEIRSRGDGPRRAYRGRYLLALGFGLIHGLGFSNFLRAVLGAEESIALPLFAFNVGLELGQISVVLVVLGLAFVMVRLVRMRPDVWALVLSGVTGLAAVFMLFDRFST